MSALASHRDADPARVRRCAGASPASRSTLRGAGFAIGQAEVQDAARVLATPLADRPERLRAALKALFASRHSELERFDEMFDAFWRGRGAQARDAGSPRRAWPRARRANSRRARRRRSAGRPAGSDRRAGARWRRAGGPRPQGRRVRARGAVEARTSASSAARRNAPRRTRSPNVSPARMRARLTRRERARAQRPAGRPARDDPAQRRARRRADRPEISPAQAEAAAPRRAARRLGLDGALHRRSSRASCTRSRRRSANRRRFCFTPASRMSPRRCASAIPRARSTGSR